VTTLFGLLVICMAFCRTIWVLEVVMTSEFTRVEPMR
jgi:hypothetical protein